MTVLKNILQPVLQPVLNPVFPLGAFFDLLDTHDRVSKNFLTGVSAGAITYINSSGGLVTVAAGVPLYIPVYGITSVPNLDQSLANPATPATQTTDSLGIGFKTLWIENGTSVAISAGTATIVGAGSATPGVPLTFEVTVAGTVTATVNGGVTRFNLVDQSYSTYPIFVTSKGQTADRAGTVSADSITADFPRLLDALDGVADGPNVTPVKGEWLKDQSVSTTDEVYTFNYSGVFTELLRKNNVFLAGSYNEIKIHAVVTSGDFTVVFGNTPILITISATGTYIIRGISTDGNQLNRLQTASADYVGTTYIEYTKQISPAAAALRTKIRFNVDADDLADGSYQLISSDETNGIQLYYFKSGATREIRAFDGVNTASVTLDAAADTIYSVGLCYGYHIASAARKMQIDVDGITGALSAVADAWPISNDAMVFGYNNDILTGLGEPSFSITLWSGWRAQA